jgi:NAD(P)H-hydrate epimerase
MTSIRFLASSEEVRTLDRALASDLGLPSVELMEVAGSGCFLLIREEAERSARLVVVAGPGQNGGDGFVIARYAAASQIPTAVFALKPAIPGTPSHVQLARLCFFDSVSVSIGEIDRLSAELARPGTLVVDAIFGTGIKQPLRADSLPWIEAVNRARGPVVAIDLPSGLDGDTGASDPMCVRAARTLTIGAIKPGLLTEAGARQAGAIAVVPLPYPPHRVRNLQRIATG